MVSKRVSVLTALVAAAGACLVGPSTALGGVAGIDVSDEAEIIASAFDGGGDSAVTDRAGRIGFSEFLASVEKSDRNADSGRSARSTVVHETQILEDGDATLGLDSTATATARARDPQPGDSFVPVGRGTSHLVVDFEVSTPVKFSLTGDLTTSTESVRRAAGAGPARRGATGCTRVIVTSPDGSTHTVHSPGGCGSPASAAVEETGDLGAGTHRFSVEMQATAGGSQGVRTAEAEYDLKLRFCTIVVPEPNAITLGGSGDNVICGTPGVDEIHGQSGADRIFGLGGDDTLTGGADEDKIDGGEGAETQIYGGPGNDSIDAGPGDDGPVGVPAEVVAGGPGDDQIDGGPGDDRILGRCGETLLGDFGMCPGDPVTPGESDDDNVVGGLGDDFLFGDAGPDLILGGGGFDFVNGDGGSDTIEGGSVGDSLDGGEGADQLFGEGGKDALFGAAAGDCLVGGPSRDELFGGGDDDKLLAKDGGKDTGSGGAGPDRGRFDPVDAVASVSNRNFQGGC